MKPRFDSEDILGSQIKLEFWNLNWLIIDFHLSSSYIWKYIQFPYIESSARTESIILFIGQLCADEGHREDGNEK